MSLAERLNQLESDLLARPPRISAYSELPCALFQYPEDAEWEFRRELSKLRIRIENQGNVVRLISLGEILWKAVAELEGLEPLAELEDASGWEEVQNQLRTYLSDADFAPLTDAVAERAAHGTPTPDIVFLWRAGALGPGIYLLSKLLDGLKGKLAVPTVLFYPGAFDDRGLRFMGLADRESGTNYRVKIYH